MYGRPIKGTPIEVFTAGWFSGLGEKFAHIVNPLLAGWFSKDYDEDLSHTTQNIYFICGRHKATQEDSLNYRNFSVLPNDLTRKCSDVYDGDRKLLQSLAQESINKFGIPIEYYWVDGYDSPYNTAVDKVFGETNVKTVVDVWDIMVSYKLQRESRTWSKFGIGAADQITLFVPKASFEAITGGRYPQTGDLFREVTTGRLFEITDREEGEPMAAFLQSRQYVWELKAVPYAKQEKLFFAPKTQNSYLASVLPKVDVLDITNDVDVKVEPIKYEPAPNEEAQKNPFASW